MKHDNYVFRQNMTGDGEVVLSVPTYGTLVDPRYIEEIYEAFHKMYEAALERSGYYAGCNQSEFDSSMGILQELVPNIELFRYENGKKCIEIGVGSIYEGNLRCCIPMVDFFFKEYGPENTIIETVIQPKSANLSTFSEIARIYQREVTGGLVGKVINSPTEEHGRVAYLGTIRGIVYVYDVDSGYDRYMGINVQDCPDVIDQFAQSKRVWSDARDYYFQNILLMSELERMDLIDVCGKAVHHIDNYGLEVSYVDDYDVDEVKYAVCFDVKRSKESPCPLVRRDFCYVGELRPADNGYLYESLVEHASGHLARVFRDSNIELLDVADYFFDNGFRFVRVEGREDFYRAVEATVIINEQNTPNRRVTKTYECIVVVDKSFRESDPVFIEQIDTDGRSATFRHYQYLNSDQLVAHEEEYFYPQTALELEVSRDVC